MGPTVLLKYKGKLDVVLNGNMTTGLPGLVIAIGHVSPVGHSTFG